MLVTGLFGLLGSANAFAAGRGLVEVAKMRMASSQTFQRPDGSFETKVFADPVYTRRANGSLVPIDPTLVPADAGRFTQRAGAVDLSLPGDLADGDVRLEDGHGRAVAFSVLGASHAAASVRGATASYEQAIGSASARLEALSDGVKENLQLPDASAPSRFRYAFTFTRGLSPRLSKDGSVVVQDHAGAVRFVLPAPTVQQAGQKTASPKHVHFELAPDKRHLDVLVDPTWLASAKFPVVVDPTIRRNDSTICQILSSSPTTTSCGAATVTIGRTGSTTARALVRYPNLGGVPQTASILSARFEGDLKGTGTGAGTQMDGYELMRPFSAGASWNTSDGSTSWTTPGGDLGTKFTGASTISPTSTSGFGLDVDGAAQKWVRGMANNGLVIKAKDETAANTLVWAGAGASDTLGDGKPVLSIWWQAHPGRERDGKISTQPIDDRSDIGVNDVTGNLTATSSDISLPGVAGLDLSIGRAYNSTDASSIAGVNATRVERPMGTGWTTTINGLSTEQLQLDYNRTRAIFANAGAAYRFDRDPAHDDAGSGDIAYSTPPGIDADLVRSGAPGGLSKLTFRTSGLVYTYKEIANPTAILTKITDRHGNHIDIAYRSDNQIDAITDTHGRVTTFHYDAASNLTSITNGTRTWSYSIATSGGVRVLRSYTNPDGKTTTYSYYGDGSVAGDDLPGRLTYITDARGHHINIGYAALNGADAYKANDLIRQIDTTSANDADYRWDYAPTYGTACTDPTAIGKTFEGDPRLNKDTVHCYNANGQVIQTFDVLGRMSSTSFSSLGNVVDLKSNPGTANPLHLTYNTNGSPTGGTKPAGETFGTGYCTPAQCATAGDSSGGGPLGAYRPRNSTDEQGVQTTYGYNTSGDLTDVRDTNAPTVAKATLAYNADGTIASSSDANANQTTYAYNASHELTTITPPSSTTLIGKTTMAYDAWSRVASVTDGNNKTATITRDGEDRVTQITWTGGKTFVFTYDPDGNLTKREEKNSPTGAVVNTSSYVYDDANRRTSESFPGSLTNSYGYDKDNNLTSFADPAGSTTYAYDDINRLASITSPTSSGNDTINYSYTDTSGVSGAPYQQLMSYPGGLKQETDRDASGKIVDQLIRDNSNTVLRGQVYAYADGSNQRALLQSVLDQPANTTTRYTYGGGSVNNVPRLTKAETTANVGGAVTDRWTYLHDANGNRTETNHSVGTTATPTGVKSYGYNAANEICRSATVALGSSTCTTPPTGATTYSYDAAGNQLTGSLGYDALNRLTSLSTTALSYLSPSNDELTGNGTTSYQNSLLGLSRQIPASGSSTAYVRQPDGTPVAQRVGTSKQHLFADRLGSVVALADDGTNALTSRYAYDPDGNRQFAVTGTGSGASTDLGFTGGHTLGSNLVHFGARFYDARMASWTQLDPVYSRGDLYQANRFGYAGGDPVNFTDPEGTDILGIGHAASNVYHHAGEALAGAGALAGGVAVTAACAAGVEYEGPEVVHCVTAGASLIGAGGILLGKSVDDKG